MFAIFSRNGQLLPVAEATVPYSHIEYSYGFVVYETMRAVKGEVRFLDDHIERLFRSARIIELEHPFQPEEVRKWILALVAKLDAETCNLKILLIPAKDVRDSQLVVLPLAPLFVEKKLYARGATAITFHYERLFPQAKTMNMFGSYYAFRKAKKAGCYDALLINHRGCITEGTRTNVFAIRGKTIFSPPLRDILEGVTRKHVLEIAVANGFTVKEGDILFKDLRSYDAIFLTSTSTKILPLAKVDDVEFAEVPEALKELMRLFDESLS